MDKPEWASMKIKFYFAVCWCSGVEDCPYIQGVNWFNDQLLFACSWFHNWFVQPFFENVGFPYKVLEIYDDRLKEQLQWQK